MLGRIKNVCQWRLAGDSTRYQVAVCSLAIAVAKHLWHRNCHSSWQRAQAETCSREDCLCFHSCQWPHSRTVQCVEDAFQEESFCIYSYGSIYMPLPPGFMSQLFQSCLLQVPKALNQVAIFIHLSSLSLEKRWTDHTPGRISLTTILLLKSSCRATVECLQLTVSRLIWRPNILPPSWVCVRRVYTP